MIELLLKVDKVFEATSKVTKDLMSGNAGTLGNLADKALDSGVVLGKNIIIALIILIIGHFINKCICTIVARMMRQRDIDPGVQSFVNSFVNITLMVLLIVTVIGAVGINTTSFAALVASAGVAIGMAFSGNLQNLAGGLIILILKPYKIGDYIEAQGHEGYVKAIQIFHTILVTSSGKEVFVPNGVMSSGSIVNWNSKGTIRVQWIIGVEYGESIDKARRALLDCFSENPLILTDPAPSVNLDELAASSVNLVVKVWTGIDNYWKVYYGAQEDIYKAFNKEGINFPFPQMEIHNK